MKKGLILATCLLFAFALTAGCTAQKEKKTEGAAGQVGEAADSTRLDAAGMADSMSHESAMPDSMAEHDMSHDSM